MKKKTEKGRKISKIERTGDRTVSIHHENGDTFEGVVDKNNRKFAEEGRNAASRFHIPHGKVRITNVMSNKDRRKLGLEEDPDLAE